MKINLRKEGISPNFKKDMISKYLHMEDICNAIEKLPFEKEIFID